MAKALAQALLGLSILFCLSTRVHADTIYLYQGNDFDHFHGTAQCPSECGMIGGFVVADPLPSNLVGGGGQFQFDVTPLAFAFTDGSVLATNFNSCADFFSIGTDSVGNINTFVIRLFTPTTLAPCS